MGRKKIPEFIRENRRLAVEFGKKYYGKPPELLLKDLKEAADEYDEGLKQRLAAKGLLDKDERFMLKDWKTVYA